MKTNELKASRQRLPAGARAFTLTELLVVVGVVAMLSAVLLSAAFTTKERVLRAHCVNNLRQIGVGISLYAVENGDYVPQRNWPQSQLPWQTYEACRVGTDGKTITRGPYNLAMMFFTRAVPDPKSFYCPSAEQISAFNGYAYYSTQNWPSTPAGTEDDNVRATYNYYPQPRQLGRVNTSYGVFDLPTLTYARMTFKSPNPGDPAQGSIIEPIPLKMTEVDPKKSMTTDIVNYASQLYHRASGEVAGVNALFPDGRVVFQNARTDTRTSVNSPWYPGFWNSVRGGPGNDVEAFLIIMSEWQP